MHRIIIAVAVSFQFTAQAVSEDFIRNKAELRRRYETLYSQPVLEISATERIFHRGRLVKRDGINVLELHGDAFEMAFQHGKLLKNEIADGAAIDASKMVERAIDVTYGHRPVFAKLAKNRIDKKFTTALLRNAVRDYPKLSQSVLEGIFAISESTGISTTTLLDGALNPSVMMMLANGARVNGERLRMSPANGCTSVVAWGPYTVDGKFLIGRNTDYPLTGGFERNATLIYFHPSDGGQRFLSVITAGVHSAGVLALNESGLYLATHSLPSKQTGPTGVPVIMWMHDIIKEARSIDEALSLIRARKFDVGWTFVLVSERENRVLSVEVDHSGIGIRESFDGKHVQTNHYLTKELSKNTLYFNQGTYEETHSRFNRADELIESQKGKLNESRIIGLLSDPMDFFTRLNFGFPSAIAATTTTTSILYKPSEKKLLVALGTAPSSHNRYVAFPTPDSTGESIDWDEPVPNQSHFAKTAPRKWEALKLLIGAKQVFEYQNSPAQALKLITRAVELAPEVGHYALMKGMLEIRLGRHDEALGSLTKISASEISPHGKRLAHYYRGRLYANSGRKNEAIADLREATKGVWPTTGLTNAVEKALHKVEQGHALPLRRHEVIPQFQFGDSQTY